MPGEGGTGETRDGASPLNYGSLDRVREGRMDEQGWRPIHANHAIEKCVATIGFEEPLTGEYLQSRVLSAAEAAAAPLGMKSVIQPMLAAQIEIDASAGVVLRAPQRQPPLNGAVYILQEQQGGTTVLEMHVMRQMIMVTSHRYTSWADLSATLRATALGLVPLYRGLVKIAAVKLEYFDRFVFLGGPSTARPGDILREDSGLLPRSIFEAGNRGETWHMHSGRFVRAGDGVRRLENLNADCVDGTRDGKPIRTIALWSMAEDRFLPDAAASYDGVAQAAITEAYVESRLDSLHDGLKGHISTLLTADMLRAIGMATAP